MSLAESSVIDGRYRLERRLGEGGMGVVYEARHLATGRRLAIKVIPGDRSDKTDAVARFQREARAAGQIESRHVARVVDTGRDEVTGDSYLAMDLLQGEDVSSVIERLGLLSPDLALRIASQACAGLMKAHEAGVIHRDIKPSNLFLARQDGGEIVVTLLDFGIAKMGVDRLASVGESALTRTGSLVGSPLYMSPEQAKGSKTIDHRTDIWSLGVVLYEALTGAPPNSTTDSLGSLIFAICSQPPPPVQERAPWIRREVAALLQRALALDPKARFASAAEMRAALRAMLPSGDAIDESALTPIEPAHRALAAERFVVRPPASPEATGGNPHVSGFAPTVSGTTTDAMLPRIPAWRRGPIVASMGLAGLAAVGVGAMLLHRASTAPASAFEPGAANATAGVVAPPPAVVAPWGSPSTSPVVAADTASATPSATPSATAAAPHRRSTLPALMPVATASRPVVPVPPPAPRPPPTSGEVDREFH